MSKNNESVDPEDKGEKLPLTKQDKNKVKLLEELQKSHGVISLAVQNVGICRKTFYNYTDNDEEFAEAVELVNESAIDHVESKLFELINGVTVENDTNEGVVVLDDNTGEPVKVYKHAPNTAAVIFFLKTRAKDRGYVERQEVTGKDGKELGKWKIEVIDVNHSEDGETKD